MSAAGGAFAHQAIAVSFIPKKKNKIAALLRARTCDWMKGSLLSKFDFVFCVRILSANTPGLYNWSLQVEHLQLETLWFGWGRLGISWSATSFLVKSLGTCARSCAKSWWKKKRDWADLQKYFFGSNIERNRPQFFCDWTCIQTTQGLRTAIGEKSKPITKGKFFPWTFLVCFVTQDTWPAQDSNLESPAPEADALSIGPTGHHIWKIVAVGCIVLGIPIQTNKTSRPHHKILNC